MNALRNSDYSYLTSQVDDLVASFGTVRVISVAVLNLFKRSRPPDVDRALRRASPHEFTNHLRRDLGLPENEAPRAWIDYAVLARRDLF